MKSWVISTEYIRLERETTGNKTGVKHTLVRENEI